MKYIIMAGGIYKKFEKPKQLLEVNGEVLIERTIRLLKENAVTDIAISTNNPAFEYLDVEKLRHENDFICNDTRNYTKSKYSWLNAYYPTEEPCCYLYGDVYYSDNAIKTIVNAKVKDTMFFCIRDLSDGRPKGVNTKGREPLAYKVQNQKVFRKAINDLFKMIDDGKFTQDPISWNLYRKINGLEIDYNGYGNGIFDTKGDYIVIDDYSTDIDSLNDIQELERLIKIEKGEIKMVKVQVTEQFYLGKFNELRNIQRYNPNKNDNGSLYKNDIFECDEEMLKYLTGKNATGRSFVKLIEIIPEKAKEEAHKLVEQAKEKEIIKPAKEAFKDVEPVKPKRRRTIAKND